MTCQDQEERYCKVQDKSNEKTFHIYDKECPTEEALDIDEIIKRMNLQDKLIKKYKHMQSQKSERFQLNLIPQTFPEDQPYYMISDMKESIIESFEFTPADERMRLDLEELVKELNSMENKIQKQDKKLQALRYVEMTLIQKNKEGIQS